MQGDNIVRSTTNRRRCCLPASNGSRRAVSRLRGSTRSLSWISCALRRPAPFGRTTLSCRLDPTAVRPRQRRPSRRPLLYVRNCVRRSVLPLTATPGSGFRRARFIAALSRIMSRARRSSSSTTTSCRSPSLDVSLPCMLGGGTGASHSCRKTALRLAQTGSGGASLHNCLAERSAVPFAIAFCTRARRPTKALTT